MKKLIASLLTAAALVAPVAAHAIDIATMPNRDNGLIVLTNDVSDGYLNCTSGRRMYVTGGAGTITSRGCWTFDDTWAFVRYDGEPTVRRYPLGSFTMTAPALAKQ
jgi:hypothetical protein